MVDAARPPWPSLVPPPTLEVPRRHEKAPAPGATLPTHNPGCVACGTGEAKDLGIRLTAGEGLLVTGRFMIDDSHQGAPGLAHGGILAAACDEVLGGLLWLLWAPAVTASLQVDYRAPVPVGTTVEIEARAAGRDGRKVYATGVGRDVATGRTVVEARALFVEVPLEHFTRHGARVSTSTMYAP